MKHKSREKSNSEQKKREAFQREIRKYALMRSAVLGMKLPTTGKTPADYFVDGLLADFRILVYDPDTTITDISNILTHDRIKMLRMLNKAFEDSKSKGESK